MCNGWRLWLILGHSGNSGIGGCLWWLFGIYVGLWWLVVGLWRWPDGSVGLLQTKRGGEIHTKRRR